MPYVMKTPRSLKRAKDQNGRLLHFVNTNPRTSACGAVGLPALCGHRPNPNGGWRFVDAVINPQMCERCDERLINSERRELGLGPYQPVPRREKAKRGRHL